jgi:hypothetical protein
MPRDMILAEKTNEERTYIQSAVAVVHQALELLTQDQVTWHKDHRGAIDRQGHFVKPTDPEAAHFSMEGALYREAYKLCEERDLQWPRLIGLVGLSFRVSLIRVKGEAYYYQQHASYVGFNEDPETTLEMVSQVMYLMWSFLQSL